MEKYRFWFSKRFFVAILCFISETNMFSCRANLNIAILDMTSSHEVVVGNTTIKNGPEFKWDSKTKGLILSAHAYGSLLSPLGGYLAMKLGGSTMITFSTLILSILTILTPWIVRYNFYFYVVVRLVEGITQAFRFVSFPELWSHWSPIRDRSKLMAITICGVYAGPAITYPIFGLITQNFGWPATFYYTGGFSLIWTVIWFLLVTNSPLSDKWISKEELKYIQQDPQQFRPKSVKTISKKMIFSKPVQALGIARIVCHFGTVITVTYLPMYIKDLTSSQISKVGVYSAIPTIINLLSVPSIGFVLDHMNNAGSLTTTQVHKVFMCGAFTMGGIILLTTAHLPYNFILLMVCLTSLKLCISVDSVLCQIIALAMAPKCSGILTGFLSLHHVLGAAVGPMIVAFIVTDNSISQWSTCFIIFAMFSFVSALIFFIFGSSEPQSWSYSINEQNEVDVKSNEEQITTHS